MRKILQMTVALVERSTVPNSYYRYQRLSLQLADHTTIYQTTNPRSTIGTIDKAKMSQDLAYSIGDAATS